MSAITERLIARLTTFLDRLVHFMDSHAPLLCEVQKQGVLPQDEVARQILPHLWLPWLRTTVAMLLQQAQQNGETADLDIPYLVDAILAPLNADLFIYQRQTLGFDLERISRSFRRLVLASVKRET